MYFEEKDMREILKESSKTGDRFTAILDLQNNEERVLFLAWEWATQLKVFRASL